MNTEIVKSLKITHFIDPNRFFCRDLRDADEDSRMVAEMAEKLKEMAEKRTYTKIEDKIELIKLSLKSRDFVGYYDNLSKIWIRCQVDMLKSSHEELLAFLWAVDFGVPFYTNRFSQIMILPQRFKFPKSKIFVAGLRALPAHFKFDHVNIREIKEVGEMWTERGIDTFCKALENATEILFIQSTKVSHHEVLIGELLVRNNEVVQYGITSKLVEESLAVNVPDADFQMHFEHLIKVERWNDYKRSGGVRKSPNSYIMPEKLRIEASSGSELNGSTEYTMDDRESINRKVLDWYLRNEGYSYSDTSSNSETQVSDCGLNPSIAMRQQAKLFMRLKQASKVAKQERKQAEKDESETYFEGLSFGSSSRIKAENVKREPIILAAGSQFPQRKFQCEFPAVQNQYFESIDDDFESASEVAAKIASGSSKKSDVMSF